MLQTKVEPVADKDEEEEVNVESDETGPLIENFDENFVDRVAEPVAEGEGTVCEVCYEEFKAEDFFSLKCGHSFCVNC